MKLNDLIADMIKSSRKKTNVQGGLFMLTVEMKAEPFVRAELPDAVLFDFKDRDGLRNLRAASVQCQTDWPVVIVACHNPHVIYTVDADISLHVWKDGNEIKTRCEKFRGDIVGGYEVVLEDGAAA